MQGRKLVALILGVCVISAAIGSGITLLAQEGPEGSQGPRGVRGPQGKEGYASGEEEGEQARQEVQDLERSVQNAEDRAEEAAIASSGFESDIAELGGQIDENTHAISENAEVFADMCHVLELTGCPIR